VQLAQQLKAPYPLGWGYYSLGVVASRADDRATARGYFRQGLDGFDEAGYEFGTGVIHYQMGRLALDSGDLDGAVEHFSINIHLMEKYDKPVLVARAMVDICEIYLTQKDPARLDTQAAEAERLIVDQGNHVQLARLRLIQAQMSLHHVLSALETDGAESSALELMANRCLDALLAGAQTPRPMLQTTIEQIEHCLTSLANQGQGSLAQMIVQLLVSGVDQALEGVLAQHGQLVVLPSSALKALQALDLAQRWATLGERQLDREGVGEGEN
jgi:hypothetical protein